MSETLYYLAASFVSAVLLIFVSKVLLPHPLKRSADYYEKKEKAEEAELIEKAGIVLLHENKDAGKEGAQDER
jgi:hypothetical protein